MKWCVNTETIGSHLNQVDYSKISTYFPIFDFKLEGAPKAW